jgi:hypothetical protein
MKKLVEKGELGAILLRSSCRNCADTTGSCHGKGASDVPRLHDSITAKISLEIRHLDKDSNMKI